MIQFTLNPLVNDTTNYTEQEQPAERKEGLTETSILLLQVNLALQWFWRFSFNVVTLSPLHTKPISAVDRCRAVDERCVALLRLVCLGVSRTVVFGKAPWASRCRVKTERTRYLLFVCITQSVLLLSVIMQSVFRLLPLLNDEYTLPPPAGKESYCHSRMRSAYVLLGRRLKSLRCVPVWHMAKTQRREATQQSSPSGRVLWCQLGVSGP